MLRKKCRVDGRPTVSEWPVRIWSAGEIPEQYAEAVNAWIKGAFSDYQFVHAPKRRTSQQSYAYVFGYGKDRILFFRESETGGEAAIRKEEILRQFWVTWDEALREELGRLLGEKNVVVKY